MPNKISSFEEYQKVYAESIADPEKFWADIAEGFSWHQKWNKVLEWNFKDPAITWFEGAKLNITENCIDRHLSQHADKIAIIWEPNEPGDNNRILTYRELHKEVCKV